MTEIEELREMGQIALERALKVAEREPEEDDIRHIFGTSRANATVEVRIRRRLVKP